MKHLWSVKVIGLGGTLGDFFERNYQVSAETAGESVDAAIKAFLAAHQKDGFEFCSAKVCSAQDCIEVLG
jgi:hypothetical protein